MKNLPVPTAKDINEAHRLARSSAETAVQHAIKCGQMLLKVKASLRHGDFEAYVNDALDFATSTARKYMKAASQNATGVAFSSLQSLFPSGTKPKTSGQSDTSAQRAKGAVMNPPESAAQGSEAGNRNMPVGVDAGQVRPPAPAPEPARDFMPEPEPDEPECPEWEPEEDEKLAAIEREIAESTERVMQADDKLAAAYDEIKRQAAEIAVLKLSRDQYMNGKAGITEQFKRKSRECERLKKQLEAARSRAA